jgi:hypothetical protein
MKKGKRPKFRERQWYGVRIADLLQGWNARPFGGLATILSHVSIRVSGHPECAKPGRGGVLPADEPEELAGSPARIHPTKVAAI